MKDKGLIIFLIVVLALLAGFLFTLRRGKVLPKKTMACLYFSAVRGNNFYLQEVDREIEGKEGFKKIFMETLSLLLAGPTIEEKEKGLSSNVPSGTKILGVRFSENVAYLDFSKEVESGGGIESMEGRLREIVWTATQFSEVEKVRILIEGEEIRTFGGEGLTEVEKPLGREDLNPIY